MTKIPGMNKIGFDPLAVMQLCIDRGLHEGYESAHSEGVPLRESLIGQQHERISHHLNTCLSLQDHIVVANLCIYAGLREGYHNSHDRQKELPCRDDLVCDQYHEIMWHLRRCFEFFGTGYDEE